MAPAESATVRRDGTTLVLAGRLDRAAATALWPRTQPLLAGIATVDLHAVEGLDSAGLALLSELATRIAAAGARPQVAGNPPGLAELRAAYRMAPDLQFAGTTP